jgi:hypothetical protein
VEVLDFGSLDPFLIILLVEWLARAEDPSKKGSLVEGSSIPYAIFVDDGTSFTRCFRWHKIQEHLLTSMPIARFSGCHCMRMMQWCSSIIQYIEEATF